jgi:hypothetical protein
MSIRELFVKIFKTFLSRTWMNIRGEGAVEKQKRELTCILLSASSEPAVASASSSSSISYFDVSINIFD